jgi:hypothetical protein
MANERLTRRQKLGLGAGFCLWVVFGGLVEYRSALLSRHMGDVGVYFRAAWAVRSGADLYDTAVSENGHYCYPPLLAICMAPLADPPAGVDRQGMLPFAALVAVWYVVSLTFLFGGIHLLAAALEQRRPSPPTVPGAGLPRWWALRLVPVWVCLVPIGHTLMRGQVNLLVVFLLCGCLAAVLRGRSFLGGLSLAGAICIKIYPAYLLLYPLWRRDGRFLAGSAAGLVLGLAVIPSAVLGPARALEYARRLNSILVMPALGLADTSPLDDELLNVTATDSQSILATLHNTLHPNRDTRPRQASTLVRLGSLGLGGLLTVATLLACRRRGCETEEVIFFGLLVVNMLLLSSVCHLHYLCMAVPLVMGLMTAAWRHQQQLGAGLTWLLVAYAAANVPPQVPGLELLRDCGLAMYAVLALWLAGVAYLWRNSRRANADARPARIPSAA